MRIPIDYNGSTDVAFGVPVKIDCAPKLSIANLWAATGWFLERFQKTFHLPEKVLSGMEKRRPRSKQYLERDRRGGILAKRWNLILPKEVFDLGKPEGLSVKIR